MVKRRAGHANGRGPTGDPRIHRIVLEDLRRVDLKKTFRQDLKDLYRFYIDDDQRSRLTSMGPARRFSWRVGWLFKNMLLRLSPARRLLLLLSLILLAVHRISFTPGEVTFSFGTGKIAYLILLVVLMLELKDKLLARDEIEVARQVQLSLLPDEFPAVDGWTIWGTSLPANDVGGDLVDYVRPGGDRLGIVLGDVAGKGMGAALLTAKLQATLRALTPQCPALDELGSRLNTILHRDGLDNRYSTLFYCEILPGGERLRYLNAGHNPPMLVGSGEPVTLGASSYPLGMLPSATYAEETVQVSPGDLLLLYSDGLTEATDASGNEFGVARLNEVILGSREGSPREIGNRILKEVERFMGEMRLHDDLSLVVIRKT